MNHLLLRPDSTLHLSTMWAYLKRARQEGQLETRAAAAVRAGEMGAQEMGQPRSDHAEVILLYGWLTI